MGKTGNPDIQEYLDNNSIDTPEKQGFLLHLATDYLFYKIFLDNYEGGLYHDYNKTNKFLIEKYGVGLLDDIKDEIKFEEGPPEILNSDSLCEFIDEVSKIDLLDRDKLMAFLNSFKVLNEFKKGEKQEVTPIDMANSAKEHQLTTQELNKIKLFFERLKNLFKGKGIR